jgi:hypothetical protein
MPSPFPGMDPYLEAPDIWPDFHDALATEIRAELNQALPAPYYARLEMRPEVGIVDEGKSRRRIIPDIAVVRPIRPAKPGGAGVAVLDRPRRDVSNSLEITLEGEPIRHHFVEVRDSSRGHKLVTLIEILSPSNKRPGPDRDAYRAKQGEVLGSDASLIEIDLLRGGEHVMPNLNLSAFVAQIEPPPDYLVLISRAWKRGAGGGGYVVFPCGLREWLPCVSVPLKEDEDEVLLDLQFVANRAYAGGPYLKGAVDYAKPPDPPLPPQDAAWAEELLRARGLGARPLK